MTLEQARSHLPRSDTISDEELSRVLADLYEMANIAVDEMLQNHLIYNLNHHEQTK